MVAHKILVSAQGPLVLVLRIRVLGQGFTIKLAFIYFLLRDEAAIKKHFDAVHLHKKNQCPQCQVKIEWSAWNFVITVLIFRAGSRIYRRTSVKYTRTLKSMHVLNVEEPSARSVMWGCTWSGFTTKEGTCVRSVARLFPRSGTTWRSVTTSQSSTLRMYRFSGQWYSVVSLRIISTAWIFLSYFVKCYDVFIITYVPMD